MILPYAGQKVDSYIVSIDSAQICCGLPRKTSRKTAPEDCPEDLTKSITSGRLKSRENSSRKTEIRRDRKLGLEPPGWTLDMKMDVKTKLQIKMNVLGPSPLPPSLNT